MYKVCLFGDGEKEEDDGSKEKREKVGTQIVNINVNIT